MDLRVASKASLESQLHNFEQEFDLKSADFFRLYRAGDAPDFVPPHEQIVWADTCVRWQRVASVTQDRSRERAPLK
jgi:hypothetical protein